MEKMAVMSVGLVWWEYFILIGQSQNSSGFLLAEMGRGKSWVQFLKKVKVV